MYTIIQGSIKNYLNRVLWKAWGIVKFNIFDFCISSLARKRLVLIQLKSFNPVEGKHSVKLTKIKIFKIKNQRSLRFDRNNKENFWR